MNKQLWNKIRYTVWSPGYDFAARILDNTRAFAVAKANIKANERVLIVGAGTGLDLQYIPVGAQITATDLTPAMIALLRKRLLGLNRAADTFVMDGQQLEFANETFDVVLLHLILAVIPDPVACLREAERVLKPGGRIVVFDKFVKPGQSVSALRHIANVITSLLFSDITRRAEEIIATTSLVTVADYPRDLKGNFRVILLAKQKAPEADVPVQPE